MLELCVAYMLVRGAIESLGDDDWLDVSIYGILGVLLVADGIARVWR